MGGLNIDNMRIGVYGGTFDPPQIGHLILASEAQEQCKLDQVIWVLTPFPPHKGHQKVTALEDRLQMVELAISGNSGFILSRVDVDRRPPHFALDTMRLLKAEKPANEFFYVMGLDSVNDLTTWHKPADFIRLCDGIVVMQRHGEVFDTSKLESDFPGIRGKLFLLKTPIIEISATDIRRRAKMGKHYRYFVPEKISQYIEEHNLYQS
jgi:nicotinate-nucleotide adenylyltransferase